MPKSGSIEIEATVVEVISKTRCRVELGNGQQIRVDVAGKLRLDFIRILQGTKVLVEFSPYDLSKGRIIGIKE